MYDDLANRSQEERCDQYQRQEFNTAERPERDLLTGVDRRWIWYFDLQLYDAPKLFLFRNDRCAAQQIVAVAVQIRKPIKTSDVRKVPDWNGPIFPRIFFWPRPDPHSSLFLHIIQMELLAQVYLP